MIIANIRKVGKMAHNPYLDEFLNLTMGFGYDLSSIRYDLIQGKGYSYPIPSSSDFDFIKKILPDHFKIVSIGAGTGYYEYVMSQYGFDIIVFDLYPPTGETLGLNRFYRNTDKTWICVAQMDGIEYVPEARDRTLLLSWPPEDNLMGYHVIKKYVELGGRHVIYIGQGIDGCTGDYNMHLYLDNIGEWHLIGQHNQQFIWNNIRSEIFIYRKV